jgi:hypothetical protein
MRIQAEDHAICSQYPQHQYDQCRQYQFGLRQQMAAQQGAMSAALISAGAAMATAPAPAVAALPPPPRPVTCHRVGMTVQCF